MSKELQKNFKKIFLKTKEDVKDLNKTLNILDKNFKFNFKKKDLKKFKKFKTIALVGMGGSILVLRQYTNFQKKKIKKKIYFFNDLNENKLINFKKRKILQKFYL